MLNRPRARAIPAHPDESMLERLAQDSGVDAAVHAHVAGCPQCGAHVAELRRIRTLVRESVLREEMPRHDLAGSALVRLVARRRTSAQLNEVLAGLSAFLRSLAALFMHPEASRDISGETDPTPRTEEEHHE